MQLRSSAVHRSLSLLTAVLFLLGFVLAACGGRTTITPKQMATTSAPTAVASTALATPPEPITPPISTTVTPTIDVAQLVGEQTLPDTVSPFTGLEVDDPARLNRMPAAVKISNSPIARPQSGLSKADVVIEHLAEGSITRFTAIFHSEDAGRIGSVRSARLIDLEIPVLFDAFLVYSGASGEVSRLIEFVRYRRDHFVRRAQRHWILSA